MRSGYGVTRVEIPENGQGAEIPGEVLGPALRQRATMLAERLGTTRIWHVSSTATGGGVAELLWSSIAYQRVLGLPAHWLVTEAEPEFFRLTKRIHHGLHGHRIPAFTPEDEEFYRSVTARSAARLAEHVAPGDLALLHDPQTAGAVPSLVEAGVRIAWRCHVGTHGGGGALGATWEFLRPYLENVPHGVFTDAAFAPDYLPAARRSVITPSIDPGSPKNRELSAEQQRALLARIGLIPDSSNGDEPIGYTIQDEPLPHDVPVVTQVSRWDPLKDMLGVLRTFTEDLALYSRAHLLLAGPDPDDVADDPEGAAVFAEVRRTWETLPPDARARVHLVMLSLRDLTLNGLAVNAVQRRSTIVAQKSLEEGFGLTVTEAMWKARPLVVSGVGGLLVQIRDKSTGILVDPLDYPAFGKALDELLRRPGYAAELGRAARRDCRERFLVSRELTDYLELYTRMLDI
ncbi:glycosyltransferase [Amycolatopsis pigmentata]|uniref:Glycosyltransferase n=1 Tax=Amycolatopsis pigmentata TaxID=450801 RepID=A0ABW5G2S0_9PSEU